MQRVVVTGPGAFVVEDGPEPVPGPDELLVAPLRVGICATDLELIDRSLVYLRTGQLSLPITPGHEWVGRVVGLGGEVASFAVGDLGPGRPQRQLTPAARPEGGATGVPAGQGSSC